MLADLPVVQSHFFKMTSRTAPLLSDKKLTPKGQLAYPPKKKNHPKTSNNTKSTPPIAVAIQKNFSALNAHS